jgi:MarR family protease production transcriptional regulator HPr
MQDTGNVHMLLNYLRGAYKVLEEEWQKAAKEIGLTQAEQHILWIVFIEKEATITRVADLGLWDVSTVMQVVKRLKDKGLIKVKKKANDRRISYVELTEAGYIKRKQSEQHTYKLYDFLKDYFGQSDENAKFMYESMKFYREMNQHFHGREFASWIESSAKGIVDK